MRAIHACHARLTARTERRNDAAMSILETLRRPQNLVGGALVLLGLFLAYWNEERAVGAHRALDDGAGQVVHTLPDMVKPELEGRLIHVTGLATSEEVLRDDLFGATQRAVRLVRHVETYQWEETKKGDGKDVTYSKRWSPVPIDSAKFQDSANHANPKMMAYDEHQWTTTRARLGAYTLSVAAAERLTKFEPLPVSPEMLAAAPADTRAKFKIDGSGLVTGVATAPEVGDVRVTFQVVRSVIASIVGKQVGSAIESAPISPERSLLLVETGEVDEKTMLGQVPHEATPVFHYVRLGALALLAVGVFLVLSSLRASVDVTWAKRTQARVVLMLRSLGFALALGFGAASAPWFTFKLWLGGGLFGLAVTTFALSTGILRRRRV